MLQGAVEVAREYGTRAAWRYLEKRLGPDRRDDYEFAWKRYKRMVR